MKSPKLILGSIAATVTAADEQVVHVHGMNKAGKQSSGALMEKPHWDVPSALAARRPFANVRRPREQGCRVRYR